MISNSVRKCQVRATQEVEGACDFVRLANTCTPQQFEKARKDYPKCHVYHGGRCAWTVFGSAAYAGNHVLLEYLLDTYGDVFSNIGNEFGMTPIFCATYGDNDETGLRCIEILLRHGGDATITTSRGCETGPAGTSPLQNCINKKRHPLMTARLREIAPETEAVVPAEEADTTDGKKRKL